MAAQHVLKHEKRMKDKYEKKNMIYEYNSGVLKSTSPPIDRTPSPKKRKNWWRFISYKLIFKYKNAGQQYSPY